MNVFYQGVFTLNLSLGTLMKQSIAKGFKFYPAERNPETVKRAFVCFMGIEWSLRAFASMRALRGFFLRTRAVIKFVFRVARTNGEQRALRKFSASSKT